MNENNERLNVALYVRVSSEEQKQGHNIDSQIAELRQFASQRNWPVVGLYQDEAWSGALIARPALDRLRDDAGKKLFDAVVINDVDRLARDVTHLGVIKRGLEGSGVKVIFRKIPSENSPTHNLLVNILGSFAEFEREMIMDRTRRGRRHKVETRQQFIGAIAPYGYRYTPASPSEPAGLLSVNAEEATVVRMIFNWVDSEGLSMRQVTRRLTREQVRPRKGGLIWPESTVTRILRGSSYIGTWYYNKHKFTLNPSLIPSEQERGKGTSLRLRPKEEWIPVTLPDSLKIISLDQWQRVQLQIDRNRAFSPRNSRHRYLLSGLVRCGGCGASFCGNPSHGRFEYRCSKHCRRIQLISESVLNNSVWGALEEALTDPAVLATAIEETQTPILVGSDARAEVEAALVSLRKEESRIFEAYRLSILTPEQLSDELQMIAGRRRALEKREKELTVLQQPAQPAHRPVDEIARTFQKRLANLTFETKRSVLRLLINKIVFHGGHATVSGVIPVEDSGGIVITETGTYQRNPALFARFSFIAPIVRDRSAAQAANRANLVKANAALKRRGVAHDQEGSSGD